DVCSSDLGRGQRLVIKGHAVGAGAALAVGQNVAVETEVQFLLQRGQVHGRAAAGDEQPQAGVPHPLQSPRRGGGHPPGGKAEQGAVDVKKGSFDLLHGGQNSPAFSLSSTSNRLAHWAVKSPRISSVTGIRSGTITVTKPPAAPARTPLWLSSSTRQRAGSAPSLAAPSKKASGSGLE